MNKSNELTNLLEMASEVHHENVIAGWWDQKRTPATYSCLFMSELGEAVEGLRKVLMDDHLPQHPMWHVEIADFAIRVLDWIGQYDPDELLAIADDMSDSKFVHKKTDPLDSIMELTWNVSFAYREMAILELIQHADYVDVDYINEAIEPLIACLSECLNIQKNNNFDLIQIIKEKREYNKTRADHKIENRQKENGKKF